MYYCWFDTEYTDNDYDKAELLEVALLVTDHELRQVPFKGEGIPADLLKEGAFSACVAPPERSRISDFVLENQKDLLDRCDRDGRQVAEIDLYLATLMNETVPWLEEKKSRPVLAGNTIHADYLLARKYLPEFVKLLNFRLFDVTALKLEWLNHYGRARFDKNDSDRVREYFPGGLVAGGAKHDALYDVQASIAELAYYRAHLALRS